MRVQNTIQTFAVNNTNLRKSNHASLMSVGNDSVSFKANPKFVDKAVLENVKKFEKNGAVIGYKGKGQWVLPNLLHTPGAKFNLYLANGKQISAQKGSRKGHVIFSVKRNSPKELSDSKIALTHTMADGEQAKLTKTKTDHILTFRVNTKDATSGTDYKAGQIEKLIPQGHGAYKEVTNITEKEHKQINGILKRYLSSFF